MKKFLVQVEVRLVKNLVVTAETEEDAIDTASTISAETLALGESDNDNVLVLGDEPAGHGSGGVYLLAEEGTESWGYRFPEGVN